MIRLNEKLLESAWNLQLIGIITVCMYIYNLPNNLRGFSLDKTDHVIQNQTMVIGRYPLSDFISMERKPRNKGMFKLNF